MLRTPNGSKKLIVSALGLALAIPLIAAPASAEVSDGGFLVRSTDSENSEITATTGAVKAAIPGIPEVEIPAPVDALLGTYKCGPMSVNFTQSMAALSTANEALAAVGTAAKLDASGWGFISSTVGGVTSKGLPASTTGAQIISLTAGPNEAPALSNPLLINQGTGSDCAIFDNRTAPRDGLVVGYSTNAYSQMEARYILEDGKLNYVVSEVTSDGIKSVKRFTDATMTVPAKSATKPFDLTIEANGNYNSQFRLPTAVDGYDGLTIVGFPKDGNVGVSYTDSKNLVLPYLANRAAGPNFTNLRNDGSLITAQTGSGLPGTISGTSVAEFNAKTGKNWDGSYIKPSSLDFSIPFAPTK